MTLQASGLTHARGRHKLFANLDFEVKAGEALRVAGRNGSGKSSLLCLLAGLTEPLRGQVLWQGRPIRLQRDRYHRSLAFVGHRAGVKDDLSAVENVRASAALAGRACAVPVALKALEQFDLGPQAHLPARVLSQGQRRRLTLARLAVEPWASLLILDEPFNALDPESVQVLTRWLTRQLESGASLVYTTHQSQLVPTSQHQEIRLGAEDEHGAE